MAFGKKKNDDASAPGEAADDSLGGAFAAPDEPDSELELDVTDEDAVATEAVDAPVAEAPAPAPEAGGGADALLSMFNSSESLEDDQSAILELAGDTEIADLLDDLHTVAAALGLAAAAAESAPLAAAA